MLEGLVNARVKFVVIGGVAAAAHGSSFLTNDLDICYESVPSNVRRLAALLATWNAYPRGVDGGRPFFMDERTFLTTPVMTLRTGEGAIDVFDRVADVGSYRDTRKRSELFHVFGLRLRILDLQALIAAKRAAGRPKDFAQLPELEAILELRAGAGLPTRNCRLSRQARRSFNAAF
jgi:hypothetical protein